MEKVPTWVAFLFLFGLALIIYYPVAPYMLIDDGISGMWEVRQMNWGDILRSDHFKSLYQLHYLFLYLYYHLFGIHPVPHFCWFIFIFSVNLILFYSLMPRLFSLFGHTLNRVWALFVCVLLLTAPNNFENISWAATSHYNLAMLLLLAMLTALIAYVKDKKYFLFIFHGLFFASLFMMEMSLMYPLCIALFIIFYSAYKGSKKMLRGLFLKIFLPMLLMVLSSFLLLKILNDTYMPHDGSWAQLLPNAELMVTNFWLYLAQGIAYTQFLPLAMRDAYYAFVHNYLFWPLLLLLIGIIIFFIKKRQYLFLFLFLSSGIFLWPNLFRFGMAASSYENVRFIFFALPFIFSSLFFIVRKNLWVMVSLFMVMLFLNFIFLNQSKQDKIVAGKLHTAYLREIINYPSQDAYLLNIPSFCKQYFVFRSIRRVGIDANMHKATLDADDYTEVLWYYAQNKKDSFSVEKLATNKLFVRNNTDGVWLMYEHFGAQSYENETLKVEVLEWGGYTVEFKKPLPAKATLLLYSNEKVRNVRPLLE